MPASVAVSPAPPPVAFPPAPPPVAFPPAPPPVAFPPAPPPVAFPPAPPVVLATASKGVFCCADADPSGPTAINMILKAIVKVMTIHDCFITKGDVLQLT